MSQPVVDAAVEERARETRGTSGNAIYEAVARIIASRTPNKPRLLDVGCGTGGLRGYVSPYISHYAGIDAVRYDIFPADAEFLRADLDKLPLGLPGGEWDVVAAVETIEHLENPRAFFRELVRLAKPGGLVIVTTPNQLSLLSKLTLLLKNQFNAFQEAPGLYPAHLTALLEIDLRRIAKECGLGEIQVQFSDHGRLPGTSTTWPKSMGFTGRAFSDNVLVSAVKPSAGG